MCIHTKKTAKKEAFLYLVLLADWLCGNRRQDDAVPLLHRSVQRLNNAATPCAEATTPEGTVTSNYYKLKWTRRGGVPQHWLLPNVAQEHGFPLQISLYSYERFRLLVSSHRALKMSIFVPRWWWEHLWNNAMAYATEIHHWNKASFFPCWGKKKKVRCKYFIFRNECVQTRQFLTLSSAGRGAACADAEPLQRWCCSSSIWPAGTWARIFSMNIQSRGDFTS